MNITILSYDFRPSLGGVATCAFEFAEALNQLENMNVTVVAPYQKGCEVIDIKSSFKTIRLKLPQKAFLAIGPICFALLRLNRKLQTDAYISMLWMPSGIVTWLMGKIQRRPYFVFAHGVEVIESMATLKKRLRAKLSPIKRRVFSNARKVLCVSRFTKDKVKRISANNTFVIYNGVNPHIFFYEDGSDIKSSLSLREDVPIFFTLTRQEDYKGVDHAIQALSKLNDEGCDFYYLVGGIGPYLDHLKNLVKKYNLEDKVKVLGKVPSLDLNRYYSLATANVLLSRYDDKTPNFEGFGLVFLEAAACGTFSIGGDSGGIPCAIIDNETGILVDPNSINEIRDVFRKVIDKEINIKMLSENALTHATQKMTWLHMAKRVEAELRKCVV